MNYVVLHMPIDDDIDVHLYSNEKAANMSALALAIENMGAENFTITEQEDMPDSAVDKGLLLSIRQKDQWYHKIWVYSRHIHNSLQGAPDEICSN